MSSLVVGRVSEINSRDIPGNGGRVVWQYEDGLGEHTVAVYRADCSLLWLFGTTDGELAHSLYEHPFAHPDVPDIFSVRADALQG